jgi:oligosaccharide repeat unit polymerase
MPWAPTTSDFMLLALVIAYLTVFWYRCARHPADLLEMDTVFLLFFGVYVVVPIVAFIIWHTVADRPGFIDLIVHFDSGVIVVGLAAFVTFLLGYSSAVGPAFAKHMPRADAAWRRSEGLAISWGFLMVGAMLVGILVGNVGIETLTESEYARGYQETAGLGVLAGGVMLMQIGLIVLFLTTAERDYRAPVLPWILFIVLALLVLRTGRRRVVLETGLALLVAHHFYVRKIRLRMLALIAAASLVAFAVVGLSRAYLAEGLGSILTHLFEEFGLGEIPKLLAEPIAVLLALTETMYQVPGQEPFWLGRTFVEAFEILVPLPLYPDRPLAPSQWFVNLIDPSVAAVGGGYSFALLAEGYLNFGILGAMIVSFVEGVIVRSFVTHRHLRPSSKSHILVYAVAVSLTVMMIRGDFATLLKAGVVGIGLPTLVVAAWLGRHTQPVRGKFGFRTGRRGISLEGSS